jgi:hypothetical protein
MWGAPTILEAAVSWVSRPYVTLIHMSSGPEQRSDLSRGRSHLEHEPRRGSAVHGTSHVELLRSYQSQTGSRPVTGTHFAVIMAGPVVINSARPATDHGVTTSLRTATAAGRGSPNPQSRRR